MTSTTRVRWDADGRDHLLGRATELLQRPGRTILGIAGAPGAGKSTISAWLLEQLLDGFPGQVALVPMDGYHLAQSVLVARGLVPHKGAPETFDAEGYLALLGRLRTGSGEVVAPEFRRELNDAIAGAIPVPAEVRLVLTEGNYLLLDRPPWSRVAELLDEVWFVELDRAERLRRLVRRHHHFDRDLDLATAKAEGNDERNAVLVADGVRRCDLVVDHTPETLLPE